MFVSCGAGGMTVGVTPQTVAGHVRRFFFFFFADSASLCGLFLTGNQHADVDSQLTNTAIDTNIDKVTYT